MRVVGVIVLVALAGCTGVAPMVDSGDGCETPDDPADARLLSEQAAHEQAGVEDCERVSATLYSVSEDGTWYRADRTGETIERAPNGSDSILGDSEFALDDHRPAYVWKVTVEADPQGHGGASQSLVDAESGEVIQRLTTP